MLVKLHLQQKRGNTQQLFFLTEVVLSRKH